METQAFLLLLGGLTLGYVLGMFGSSIIYDIKEYFEQRKRKRISKEFMKKLGIKPSDADLF